MSSFMVEGILCGVPLLTDFSNTWMNFDLLKGWMYVLYFTVSQFSGIFANRNANSGLGVGVKT